MRAQAQCTVGVNRGTLVKSTANDRCATAFLAFGFESLSSNLRQIEFQGESNRVTMTTTSANIMFRGFLPPPSLTHSFDNVCCQLPQSRSCPSLSRPSHDCPPGSFVVGVTEGFVCILFDDLISPDADEKPASDMLLLSAGNVTVQHATVSGTFRFLSGLVATSAIGSQLRGLMVTHDNGFLLFSSCGPLMVRHSQFNLNLETESVGVLVLSATPTSQTGTGSTASRTAIGSTTTQTTLSATTLRATSAWTLSAPPVMTAPFSATQTTLTTTATTITTMLMTTTTTASISAISTTSGPIDTESTGPIDAESTDTALVGATVGVFLGLLLLGALVALVCVLRRKAKSKRTVGGAQLKPAAVQTHHDDYGAIPAPASVGYDDTDVIRAQG